jgi:hypothetical protein
MLSSGGAGEEQPEFNPLTVRAVGAVFKRRWAAPLTVAVICLVLHFTGLLDDPNQSVPDSSSSTADFMHRLKTPLRYAKYGLGFGALFGSGMWVLVVTLSDSAEGKPEEGVSEHWAHNNTLLLVVLLGLGTATGGILAFVIAALMDVAAHGLAPPIGA